MSVTENAIEIQGLTKIYPEFSLDNFSLTLPSGCIMGLVGENGAGKTTVMKLILNMIKRKSGTIKLLGYDEDYNASKLKEEIGIVPDEIGLPIFFNAAKTNKVMKNTFSNWDEQAFNGYVEQFAIPPKKRISEYSRGMKMKLGIAVALSHKPRLLLLDEATSGLDPVVRDEILDIFNEFTRDENHSILISSHIVSDLEKICDYIAFIDKGKLLLCEEKDALREQYAVVRVSDEQLGQIPNSAVKGYKKSAYGTEAIVERAYIPKGIEASPVDIEQLFIFMVRKGGK